MSELDRYLALNYSRRLYQDDADEWIVEIDDLPGCIADGKTPDEAIANSRAAMQSWMESRLSSGLDIPRPSVAEDYSGRILLRMPKFIHRRLAIQAQREGSSLNQYIVSLLSYGCAQNQSAQDISFYGQVAQNCFPLSIREDVTVWGGTSTGLEEVLGGRRSETGQIPGLLGGRA